MGPGQNRCVQRQEIREQSESSQPTIITRRAGEAVHQRPGNSLISLLEMARLAGIEPATLGFGGQYSIH